MSKDILTIIVPCYNEEEALSYFYKEIKRISLQMSNVIFDILFVNDGSKDDTLLEIKRLATIDKRIRYISFSRNFGKEAAIYAGLKHASGNYIVIMDADLQDPPALLPEMYHLASQEGYDHVATRRVTRAGEPRIRSFCARLFYKLINKISQIEIVDGARDYRFMSRRFVNALLSIEEYNRFSKGLFSWVGFKTKWIDFENVKRVAGETSWSFWKLLIYSIEGIVAFSTIPLVLSSLLGFISCFFAFLFVVFIVIRKFIYGDPVDGWASTMSVILFSSGLQMLCIGILGQYLSKTYLETKRRPIYIIAETTEDKKNNTTT